MRVWRAQEVVFQGPGPGLEVGTMRLDFSILSRVEAATARTVVFEAINDSTLSFDVLYLVDGRDTPEPTSDESQ